MQFFRKKGKDVKKMAKMLKKGKAGQNIWKFGQKCKKLEIILKEGKWLSAWHVHKYEADFDSFVDIGIVVTFLSLAWILPFRLWNNSF